MADNFDAIISRNASNFNSILFNKYFAKLLRKIPFWKRTTALLHTYFNLKERKQVQANATRNQIHILRNNLLCRRKLTLRPTIV